MSIHLNYQGTTCEKCGVEFIAWPKNRQCPNCQNTSDEFCDFITFTIATMKDHKQLYGNYFPESWFSSSIADLVQGVIFELFDNFEITHSASSGQPLGRRIENLKNFENFISSQLGAVEWEEGQEHLVNQTKQIALEVYDIYLQDHDFRGDNLKNKPLNPKLKNLDPELTEFKKLAQKIPPD